MVKLNVSNMKDFLQTVNQCRGPVFLISSDEKKENIHRQYSRQNRLAEQFKEEKGFMQLSLEIPDPKDYMMIVFNTVVTC